MNKINVLHLFDCYLPDTENWAYRMLKSIPASRITVAAVRFNGRFQDPAFRYMRFPLNPYGYEEGFWGRLLIPGLIKKAYPLYLAGRMRTPDIIHAHFANTGYFFLKLRELFDCPYIISLYGFDYEQLPASDPRWAARYQVLFQKADFFLCEGSSGTRILNAQGCPPEKTRIARLGVDIQHIPFCDRDKHSGRLRLLQIAAMKEKKGQVYTVQAFAAALKDCPDMHLTLVGGDCGDGTREKVLKSVQDAGIQDRITLLEAVDFNNLHAFMRDHDVFIHPSCYTEKRDCEGGAPVVLLDAQATGMPVIATRHCDIPDEVVHETTGLLAPEKDTGMLAEHIRTFYHMDADRYRTYCGAARQHVQRSYDVQACGARMRALYAAFLNQ